MSKVRDIKERFLEKFVINSDNGCWEWKSNFNANGYGRFYSDRKRREMAHRVSYRLFIREFDDSLWVLHKCDNPKCVNPNHLFLGNRNDNMQDMWNKNRHPIPKGRTTESMLGEKNSNSKLKKKDVMFIRYLYSRNISIDVISKMYPVVQKPAIWKIINRISWSYL